MKQRYMILVVMLVVLLSACAPVQPVPAAQTGSEPVADTAGADEHASVEELGQVDFQVSCTADAQTEFNHAMAYLHTFWFEPAIASFEEVAELDPTCAMAYWGKAMSMMSIPWSPMPEEAWGPGSAAVEQALALGAPTEREQGYIDAIATMYDDPATRDHRTRTLAYEAAMEQLAAANPDDHEAQILYALALLMTAQPGDKEFTNQRKASAILEPYFAELPDHPGISHYLIHSYDHPVLASQGLNAAQRFAAVAPSAPHALHMPAHIFSRLGYWQESIAANSAGVEVARADLPADASPTAGSEDMLHALDYMMYGYLQRGMDGAAKALLDEVNAMDQLYHAGFGAAFAMAAIPTRYVLEREQWSEASTMALPPAEFAWDRFPHAEAVLVFGRGLAAARAGDVEAAQQDLERLQALREGMLAINQGYWAGQADIQMLEVQAWIALAEGKNDEALSMMQEAVALEALTDKHPVTPGPIVPANELLGDMLIELSQPDEALAAFEASQVIEPNRFHGYYGAAHAAELAGNAEKAQAYYEQLVEMADVEASDRPELTAAQEYLAQ